MATFRTLYEIPFTSPRADEVRGVFERVGCHTDLDIIACGCTGLVKAFHAQISDFADVDIILAPAQMVRENMDGSGCGLPCYVPPDRFCLVHNTIGGLQPRQEQRYPEMVPICSRELTAEEKLHSAAVNTLAHEEAVKDAAKRFGATKVEAAPASTPVPDVFHPLAPILQPNMKCPEHHEDAPDWRCRYCLAAEIINGPFQAHTVLEVHDSNGTSVTRDLEDLDKELENPVVTNIALFVRVARWQQKLVRQGNDE